MKVDRGPRCAIASVRKRSEAMGAKGKCVEGHSGKGSADRKEKERVKRRSVRGNERSDSRVEEQKQWRRHVKEGGTHDVVDQPARLVDEVQAVERHYEYGSNSTPSSRRM